MSDIVLKHGGTLDKFVGDALVTFWGAPIARPDDADRAVRAGLAMYDAARNSARTRRRRRAADRRHPRRPPPRRGGGRQFRRRGAHPVYRARRRDEHRRAAGIGEQGAEDDDAGQRRGEAGNRRLDIFRPMGRIVLSGRATPVEVWEPVPDMDDGAARAAERRCGARSTAATPARSFSSRPSPPPIRRMRPCNISSIGSARLVREVILSWDRNSASRRAAIAALLAAAAASGRRQRPRRPLGGPVGQGLSGRPVAARQCADHPAGRRHVWSCSAARRHPHLPRPGHFLAERRGPGRRAHHRRQRRPPRPHRRGAQRRHRPAQPDHLACRRDPERHHLPRRDEQRHALAARRRARRRRLTITAPGGGRATCTGRRASRPSPGRPALPIVNGGAYSFRQSGRRGAGPDHLPDAGDRAGRPPGGRRRADRQRLPGASSTCWSRPSRTFGPAERHAKHETRPSLFPAQRDPPAPSRSGSRAASAAR